MVNAGPELSADADGRRVLHENEHSRDGHEFGPQFLDGLVHGEGPLVAWLEIGEDKGLIALRPAHSTHGSHAGYVGIGAQRLRDLSQMLRLGIERHILRTNHDTERETAVLAGNEAGRHSEE